MGLRSGFGVGAAPQLSGGDCCYLGWRRVPAERKLGGGARWRTTAVFVDWPELLCGWGPLICRETIERSML
jgi:hypothetical protein